MAYSSITSPGTYDNLAKCLTEKGATFYGAFWCPHCTEQKQILGKSMKYINYVECSPPDKPGQTKICNDAKIEGYPTWEFADGSRITGKQQPAVLASKAGCEIK